MEGRSVNAQDGHGSVNAQDVSHFRLGRPLVVAIDGPSGSGKSSVSREVARRMHLAYLDTGAMYRAVTWAALDAAIDLEDAVRVEALAREVSLELSTDPARELVVANGRDVTAAIREPRISEAVSYVATTMGARAELISRQQAVIAECGHRIVAEGRDITTVVAPDAHTRILLTASEESRLRRRAAQLSEAGEAQESEALRAQVAGRDAKDSAAANFTTAADGVVTLDSSDLDFEQTVQAVIQIVVNNGE